LPPARGTLPPPGGQPCAPDGPASSPAGPGPRPQRGLFPCNFPESARILPESALHAQWMRVSPGLDRGAGIVVAPPTRSRPCRTASAPCCVPPPPWPSWPPPPPTPRRLTGSPCAWARWTWMRRPHCRPPPPTGASATASPTAPTSAARTGSPVWTACCGWATATAWSSTGSVSTASAAKPWTRPSPSMRSPCRPAASPRRSWTSSWPACCTTSPWWRTTASAWACRSVPSGPRPRRGCTPRPATPAGRTRPARTAMRRWSACASPRGRANAGCSTCRASTWTRTGATSATTTAASPASTPWPSTASRATSACSPATSGTAWTSTRRRRRRHPRRHRRLGPALQGAGGGRDLRLLTPRRHRAKGKPRPWPGFSMAPPGALTSSSAGTGR